MPADYSRSVPPVPAASGILRSLTLLVLRLAAGLGLMSWHGWKEGILAWSHLWYKTQWDLPRHLASMGFPLPLPLAVALVIICLLGSLFLVLGLLTRVSAVLLAVISATSVFLYKSYPQLSEIAALYTGLCTAAAIGGPGIFALDQILRYAVPRRS